MKNNNTLTKQSYILWGTHMKSFSIKALALAFVIVTGSAQAYFGEETLNNVCEKVDSVCHTLNRPYRNAVLAFHDKVQPSHPNLAWNSVTVLTAPIVYYKTTRTILALGVAAVAYKTYKHFTKPAADATEGENVEANETTVEVA